MLRVAPAHRPLWAVAGSMANRPLKPKSMAHIFERWLPERELFITAHQLRLDLDTPARLCQAFDCTPGDLLVYVGEQRGEG